MPEPLDDAALIDGLRRRDEAAFAELVERYQMGLVRFAERFVGSRDIAGEVVQEAWIAVLQGIDRFEQRSSLRTWLYRIVANLARTRAAREARTIPFSAFADDDAGPLIDPDRFLPSSHAAAGHWASPVRPWSRSAEDLALSAETLAVVEAAIDELPAGQRTVITLRDVEGFQGDEVCNVLGISAVNQRVLLHRARTVVRRALEEYESR